MREVIQKLLEKAIVAKMRAESHKTTVAGISIKHAEYAAYLDAAQMTARASGMSATEFATMKKEIEEVME